MSIGPQIPPHLLKSRATATRDDDTVIGLSIGPARRGEGEEDEDDNSPGPSVGPALPPHLQRSKRHAVDEDRGPPLGSSIGPDIPPHLRHSVPSEDDDERPSVGPSIGPTLPPHLRRPTSNGDNDEPSSDISPSSIPPNQAQQLDAEDDDSDDDFGPQPLPAHLHTSYSANDGVREFLEKEERRKRNIEVRIQSFPINTILNSYTRLFIGILKTQTA